jgi:hypothetical protein
VAFILPFDEPDMICSADCERLSVRDARQQFLVEDHQEIPVPRHNATFAIEMVAQGHVTTPANNMANIDLAHEITQNALN